MWTAGNVKFWNGEKGYGFIEHQGQPDIYLNQSDWQGNDPPARGSHVTFRIEEGARGPRARDAHLTLRLHSEMWTEYTDTRFCSTCGGFTPWAQDHSFQSGGITGVRYREAYDGSETTEVSPTRRIHKGYCIPCKKREEEEQGKASKSKDGTDIAEVESLTGRELYVRTSFFGMEGQLVPIRIRKWKKLGGREIEVSVEFPKGGGTSGLTPWNVSSTVGLRHELRDEEGNLIFTNG